MKNFLTIRGSLLLINLVVVGLILWLASSFLYIASFERTEALYLLDSMRIEKSISRTSDALLSESNYSGNYLNQTRGVSAQSREHLEALRQDTDFKLHRMIQQAADLIEDRDFMQMAPATHVSALDQLNKLRGFQDQLMEQRLDTLLQDRASFQVSDTRALMLLRNGQTGIQDNLADLARSLKFLPNFDAAAIDTYHTLLIEILRLKIELARKDSNVTRVISGNSADSTLPGFQIAILSEKIEQRLSIIMDLALTSDQVTLLHPLATIVQNYYLQTLRPVARQAELKNNGSNPIPITSRQWLLLNSELSRLVSELTERTHEAIELLATTHAARATRNLKIDILLVLLCFVITMATMLINRRMKQHAYHDGLTNLANRLNFESTLKATSATDTESHAVIFIDLNRFKAINDNYGHTIGDELLIEVASRLKSLCNPSDLLARLGGDEFAVLIRDVESEVAVEELANRMVEAIGSLITLRELNLRVGASAGISLAPQDCEGGVELLRNADVAMYHAKNRQLQSVLRFNKTIAVDYQQRLVLEQDLRKGLENDEFHLMYQPKVCTSSGRVHGVEALLRWAHPLRGLVSPAQFIPVAEETGLMGGIGHWVLREACREISQLQKSALPNLQVAVNISPQQFGDEHFVDHVDAAIKAHGLSYTSLSLEVTESIVMTDVSRVIDMLQQLQQLGIDIAVDDFGTGYSSLQYLQELPLNTLKIDRAFIIALDNADPHSSVANSIVQLASLFNLETVAEGVETLEQETQVRSLGVHHIQGYRYSEPVSAAELPAVVEAIGEKYRATGWATIDRAA